jgi:hypothetical protein
LNCDVLQFIPESVCGSSCRRNWEGLPKSARSVLQPGHYTGVRENSENYYSAYLAAWGQRFA